MRTRACSPPAVSCAGSRWAHCWLARWRCISATAALCRPSRRPPPPLRPHRPTSLSTESMTAREIRVTLPDGSEKRLPAGATGADLARAIGPGLAKAAVAVRVDGQGWDLARPLPDRNKLAILTDKDPQA